jgi:glutamyl-tRNA synthetase
MKMPLDGDTTFNDLIRGEISFKNTDVDDTVLLKSDGYPTYHLAVVIDDHLMEITHIIRGEEWISSTPKHVQLFKAFGWELPAFAHLSLIRNKDHSKMSKRHNDVSVLSYRDKGYLPEALNNFLALLGWSHPDKKDIFTMEEYVKLFSIERLTTTAPVFDVEKLKWMNGSYIRSLTDEELAARLSGGFVPAACGADLLAKIVPLVKERLVTLKDFDELASFFYLEPSAVELTADDKEYLSVAKDLLASCEWSKEGIEGALIPAVKDHGWKNGPFFAALRLAVTGKKISPPLSESMVILGREKVLARLSSAK